VIPRAENLNIKNNQTHLMAAELYVHYAFFYVYAVHVTVHYMCTQ